jgi:hypothetical protein
MKYSEETLKIIAGVREAFPNGSFDSINIDWKTERITNDNMQSDELMMTVAVPVVSIEFVH